MQRTFEINTKYYGLELIPSAWYCSPLLLNGWCMAGSAILSSINIAGTITGNDFCWAGVSHQIWLTVMKWSVGQIFMLQ